MTYNKNMWALAVPLVGVYPKKSKTVTLKGICTPVFIAALFTTAKIWKPPKCPSTDNGIKKMWHIHTMEYSPSDKKA